VLPAVWAFSSGAISALDDVAAVERGGIKQGKLVFGSSDRRWSLLLFRGRVQSNTFSVSVTVFWPRLSTLGRHQIPNSDSLSDSVGGLSNASHRVSLMVPVSLFRRKIVSQG
jgi:hypothetical protein